MITDNDQALVKYSVSPPPRVRVHPSGAITDSLEVLWRQRAIIGIVFTAVVLGAFLAGLTRDPQFEASVKLLILHRREAPTVTAGSTTLNQPVGISEEDLNSETELFRSRDLLERVVLTCGLDRMDYSGVLDRVRTILGIRSGDLSKEQRVAQAVERLDRSLRVKAMRKTDLIQATYTSRNPKLSLRVLDALTALYIEKHVNVHGIPGAQPFFTEEVRRYQDELEAATSRLADFKKRFELGSALEERDRTTEKLVGFEADLRQAEANTTDHQERVRILAQELNATPPRIQTEVRTSDNGPLLQQMKSALLDKQLKRSELAVTFNPDYPRIRELDEEIAQTQKAILEEERAPVREETSDATPTHTFLVQELAKANVDLAAQRAQRTTLGVIVHDYRNNVRELEQNTILEAALERNVKTAETNYLLYRNKLEDSKISDALDRDNIGNVSVAEPPSKPERPSGLSLLLILAIGVVLGGCASTGAAYLIDSMATTFRTHREAEMLLGIPVLAIVPECDRRAGAL